MINEKLYHKARDRAVKRESFHLALFAKFLGLKKCKTKGSDGQPSMYIYFDYIPLLAWFSPLADFFSSLHELASCQGLTKKPD